MAKKIKISAEQVNAAGVRIRADRAVGRKTDARIVAISKVGQDRSVIYNGVEMDLAPSGRTSGRTFGPSIT